MPATVTAYSESYYGPTLLGAVTSKSTKVGTDTLSEVTGDALSLGSDAEILGEDVLTISPDDVRVTMSNGRTLCPKGKVGIPPLCRPPISYNSGGSELQSHGSVKGIETDTSDGSDVLPQISSGVSARNKLVAYTKAVIHVENAQPAKVLVRFGTAGKLTSATPISGYATKHDISINAGSLEPGTQYTYQVVLITKDGVRKVAPEQTFTTEGMTVYVTVVDKSNRPLRNKTVTLRSAPQSVTTDNNGVAKFTDVAPGMHQLEYESDGGVYSQKLSVANNVMVKDGKQLADAQRVSVMYDFDQPVSSNRAKWSLVIVGIIIVLSFGSWWWHRRRMRRMARKAAARAPKMLAYAAEQEKANTEKE
jgi:hypothetical protein